MKLFFKNLDLKVTSLYFRIKPHVCIMPQMKMMDKDTEITRLHSSRMRTAGALTVSHRMLAGGEGCLLWGVSAPGGCLPRGGLLRGCLLPGGVCSRGGLLLGGCVCSGGVSAPRGSVCSGGCLLPRGSAPAPGGVCSRGGLLPGGCEVPPLLTESQTPVKT